MSGRRQIIKKASSNKLTMAKKGVLLINVGTPDEPTVKSVRNYLREFLLDPDVIDAPYIIRQLLVRGIILRVRPKKIAPLYRKIWMDEGSPLRVYSDRITKSLNEMVEDVEFDFAMRYGNPSIESGLMSLRDKGVDELLLLPMFPHYAQATTESALKHAYKQLKSINWSPKIIEMGHFDTDEEYVIPLTNSIQSQLDKDAHLLFSYHGLPVSHVKRVDKSKNHCQKVSDCCSIKSEANSLCYGHHCMNTTQTVVGLLGLNEDQWSISFQSRIGPVKWLEPSTMDKVEELVKRGVKKLAIVAPAFLADGLETLEELDIGIREHFIELGGEELIVIKCLNDNQDWVEGLSKLITKKFSNPVAA
ncbi:MAG: ferrochelatase [Candidatus Poseidoniales archaeon]|nr:MAG: ferrochelatase [Candidatus Poseidoniales archaeon]